MAEEEYDLHALNSAFAQLRSDALGHVRPPGIAVARATLRRRRQARLATLAAAVVALIVIPVATLASTAPDVLQPSPDNTERAISPNPAYSASESAPPTASPSAQPPATQAGPGTGSGGNQNLAYTAIWYTGPLDGLRVELPQSHSFTVPIGIRVWSRNSSKVGPVTNAKLAVDLSQITSKVELVGVSGPCAIAGSSVQCDFGTLNTGNHMESLTLRARSGASVGEAGQVSLTASGNEPSWHTKLTHGKVSVGSFSEATDHTVKASMGSGRVGDTIALRVEVSNRGPRPTTYYEVLAGSRDGADVVGMSANCQPAQLAAGCRVESIPVGTTITIEIYFRIVSCAVNGSSVGLGMTYMPYDPVSYEPGNANPPFRITGC